MIYLLDNKTWLRFLLLNSICFQSRWIHLENQKKSFSYFCWLSSLCRGNFWLVFLFIFQARKGNFKINPSKPFKKELCYNKLYNDTITNENITKEFFENEKYPSRIFVFLGSRECLRYFMREMGYLGYFNDPTDRYLVIYVEKEQPNLDSYIKYSTDVQGDKNILKWSNSTHIDCRDTDDTFNLLKQSLIVVAPSL